jgi:hypothetical protein
MVHLYNAISYTTYSRNKLYIGHLYIGHSAGNYRQKGDVSRKPTKFSLSIP